MPTVIAVIDHLTGHTAVDADIFTRDKARHIRAKIEHRIGNIGRISHSARRLLYRVCALVDGIRRIDPAG